MAESEALLSCTGVRQAELVSLFALLAGSDVTELEVQFGRGRLSLRRSGPGRTLTSAPSSPTPTDQSSLTIASPLVGIFHPSVAQGAQVVAGQALGAIESLGMPTAVETPEAGTIEGLLVEDGAPVEYGQPLLLLRRTTGPV